MTKAHILGFPRIGANRELKKSLENYWNQKSSEHELLEVAARIRHQNWQWQKDANLDYITVGDFSFYDTILDLSVRLGNIPAKYSELIDTSNTLDTQFIMARGRTASGIEAQACALTKWFDTNYHYIVPEFNNDVQPFLNAKELISQVEDAQQYGDVKVALPGIITYLYLGREKDDLSDRLSLLSRFVPVYQELIKSVVAAGASVVQIDEPALATDLEDPWIDALKLTYKDIDFGNAQSMITCFFDSPCIELKEYFALNFDGFHIDFKRSDLVLKETVPLLPSGKFLSAGLIDGRNIWKANINQISVLVDELDVEQKKALWIAPSCSLLHVPFDLETEDTLDSDLVDWLAFAKQKLTEIQALCAVANGHALDFSEYLTANKKSLIARNNSSKVHNQEVKTAIANLDHIPQKRASSFPERKQTQANFLRFPAFPTTTIGSFPQTSAIRKMRNAYKRGTATQAEYETFMKSQIKQAIEIQEEIDLDVLVHGEPERNDMVEYFGELLSGFSFTSNGWVQSYGSRCVKPPVIYGDVSRPEVMTVKWSRYAQSQTDKVVKGMLTGPITILQWSFVRDDQPRQVTCEQIALAILEEVQDLAQGGIRVIQVDEPAIKEGLPLKKIKHNDYLSWAIRCFKIATSDIPDEIQIHTHMCYSEFNYLMEHIINLDADVISIETSRSHMKLLDSFNTYEYPNEIGPGVYDIHSPRIPSIDEMVNLLQEASKRIAPNQLWVNPDCGLKTRSWDEATAALKNMVASAKILRKQHS